MNKAVLRKIHLWLSAPFGLIITVVCLSGAVLVFEDEITAIYQEHRRTIESPPGAVPMSDAELTAMLCEAYGSPVSVARVVKTDSPHKAYLFIISSPRRGAVWIDQYTGEIRDHGGKLPFFEAMLDLHKSLMIPAQEGVRYGNIIVGVSVLFFILALISGIVLWVPGHFRQWLPRAGLFSMHALVGIYAMTFLLLMAATGLTWSFGWWHDMIYAIPGANRGLITVLHTGTYWGVAGKVIACVTAIVGASLPLTGYWLWYRRLRHH